MSITNPGEEHNFKFGIMLIGVLLVVAVAVFAVYMFRINQNNANQTANQAPGFFDRLFGTDVAEQKADDTDHDGIANADEAKAGTDALKADSDTDGLTDREEKFVYNTDPSNADSDSDGMKDGEEIKNRRDPKNSNPDAQWPPRPAQFTTASN